MSTRYSLNERRHGLGALLPKGLYTRSLLIIILPMVLLQSIVALVFMERHWQLVTRRLSGAVAQDISAIVDLDLAYPGPAGREILKQIASDRLGAQVAFLPDAPLPPPRRTPLFSILDRLLSREIAARIEHPFWLDTSNRFVEVRIKLPTEVMQIQFWRGQAYASNSHIFLVWMVGASVVLLTVSILFLRNQIRPILQLADAAENLGKGRDVPDFRPRGAREVRRAALAFYAMKDRIERQIEQRTAMLAGVSHDLRTVLTRLRLEIALLGDRSQTADLEADVDEMERMLAAYLAFAQGDAGEPPQTTNIAGLLSEIESEAKRMGKPVKVSLTGDPSIIARPDALKRALSNLVTNACRFGKNVAVRGRRDERELVITVDDDGPGVPPNLREDVFRPFLRLDQARNQDHPGSGLGLAIARDVARGHGGDIELSESPEGGLRARLHIPV